MNLIDSSDIGYGSIYATAGTDDVFSHHSLPNSPVC